jgi:hypothetical protein
MSSNIARHDVQDEVILQTRSMILTVRIMLWNSLNLILCGSGCLHEFGTASKVTLTPYTPMNGKEICRLSELPIHLSSGLFCLICFLRLYCLLRHSLGQSLDLVLIDGSQ